MKKTLFLSLVLVAIFSQAAFASLLPEDFSCKGVVLGESFSGREKNLGKLLFDNDKAVFGERIKYYSYKHGYYVGTDERGNVVDIIVTDTEYTGRDGVRYGATKAKIIRVYGEAPKKVIGGKTFFVFTAKENGEKRLLLEIDNRTSTLFSWRITSLPLDELEAEERMTKNDEWESNDFNAVIMRNRDIDMSEIKKKRDKK